LKKICITTCLSLSHLLNNRFYYYINYTECSVVWLSYLFWVQKTVGSNPTIPNNLLITYTSMNSKNYRLKKFYRDTFANFKTKINCFALFTNRVIEGSVYHFESFSIVDLGFKYLIMKDELLITNKINLKVIKLETILNDLHCDYIKFKNDLAFKLNWSLIKKAFINRCLLRGRVLNPIYNGFSIGVWGFVGFIPKKYSIVSKCNIRSVFVITSIDYLKNTFILSQNKVDKTSPRILFRLSSQLAYISKV
jgi:hypothetical protein